MNIDQCRGCGAEIVWLRTNAGKSMCMDADFMARQMDLDDDAPMFDYTKHKDGVHWKDCPNAGEYRRQKERA